MSLKDRLRLPILVAPMHRISGPDLVVASCRAGVIGSFPAFNQSTPEDYEQWLKEISSRLSNHVVPWATEYPVHCTNDRLDADIALTIKYRVPILITTLSIERELTDAIHAYGGLVFHHAASMRHAKKALAANVDGVIAVARTGWNDEGTFCPPTFITELKSMLEQKPLILAGRIGDGEAVASAIAAGADLAYVGARFVGAIESCAPDKLKRIILKCGTTDVDHLENVTDNASCWQDLLADKICKHINPNTAHIGKLGDGADYRPQDPGREAGAPNKIPTMAELVNLFEQGFRMQTGI